MGRMKLHFLMLLFFASLAPLVGQQQSLQTSYITDTGDTLSNSNLNRVAAFPPPSAQACISSNNIVLPYNTNNGQRGAMFDITAITNITINCFEANLAPGTTPVAIYYKVGTHVGFQVTPGAWTLLGTVNVTSLGTNLATPIPIPVNVAVAAGCTVAFYITRTTVGGAVLNYTNGTALGFVFAANADLQVKDGTGKDYPFAASFAPRRFNGTIFYTQNSAPGGGVVTGPLSICAGSTQVYTFVGAGWTNYTWTVPVGTVITSGQGTNTITIIAGSTPGNICCTPSGACGPGPIACLAVSLAPQPTATTSNVSVACFGGSTGSATITPNPVGTYTYVWSPSVGTTSTVTGLPAGVYTVVATNSGGCSVTQTITITQPATGVTSTAAQVDLLCNAANTGSATVTASGGSPGYTYSWSPSGGTGSSATNLAAGAYVCTITDTQGCTTTQSFTITSPTALTLATSSAPSLCGSPNGSATVVPSGGTGPYTYSWSPSGGIGATESGLLNGAYVVTVTDANGCTSTATVNVAGASTPTATVTASTNILCFGNMTGSATVTPAGGNGPYTYSWSPGGGTAATENSLGAGTYTVTITDLDGCTATDTVTLTEPPVLTSAVTSIDILCNGNPTGSATMTTAGGNPAYTYAWSPSGGTANTANALTAQSYTCIATDANGCTTSVSVTITEPPLLTTASSQVDELCSGGNNGSATVTPAGGSGAYTYSWSPSGGSSATAASIFAGSYTCTITDANGCTLTQTFQITEPVTVVATAGATTSVDCFGASTGSAAVNQSGGVGPYSYTWSPNATTTNSATNVAAGNYSVTVTDANGCSSTVVVTVTEPPLLTMQVIAAPSVICNGQQVTLTAAPGGGVAAYQVGWLPGSLVGLTQNVSPTSTTTYTVLVTDANGCAATTTSLVTVNPVPQADFTSNVVDGCEPVCVNFSDASIIASPGVITAWDWDFGDGNLSTIQNPTHCYTTSGIYTVILTAKSADGCTHTLTMTNYISVYLNPVAAFSASPQPTTIFNSQIYFTDSSSNATGWSWSFGDVANSGSLLQNPNFTYGAPECYTVLLTVTTPNGCEDTVSHPVCLDPDVAVYVPNSFTPDGNGSNEVFLPIGTGLDPAKYQLWIFDRWGNQLFTTTDINTGWDGKVQGHNEVCQVDTYVYRIHAWDLSGNPHSLIGAVHLIR